MRLILTATREKRLKRTVVRQAHRSTAHVYGGGSMGVLSVELVDRMGRLAGGRFVRVGFLVMLFSDGGSVIKIPVVGIRRAGRSTQGVIVMRLRDGEKVPEILEGA